MLEGERVRLRALTDDDIDIITSFNNTLGTWVLSEDDPPTPHTPKDSRKELEEWTAAGVIPFMIEADGKVIGDCGLHHISPHSGTAAFGIRILSEEHRGKGLGREALVLLLDFAFRYRNVRKMWLTVNGDNERAIRTYEGLGFVEEGRLRDHVWQDGSYHDWVYMGLMRDEWRGS